MKDIKLGLFENRTQCHCMAVHYTTAARCRLLCYNGKPYAADIGHDQHCSFNIFQMYLLLSISAVHHNSQNFEVDRKVKECSLQDEWLCLTDEEVVIKDNLDCT